MKIPPIYKESDSIIIVGVKEDLACIDVIGDGLTPENANYDLVNNLMERLSVALISIVSEEIEKNQVMKTQPLINLCKYMCCKFPELVLDDDTYHIRRSILMMEDAVDENKDADVIIDAFMEMSVDDSDKKFQLQLIAVSERHGFNEPSKVKIIKYNDEEQ
jgi:hypothetical protein